MTSSLDDESWLTETSCVRSLVAAMMILLFCRRRSARRRRRDDRCRGQAVRPSGNREVSSARGDHRAPFPLTPFSTANPSESVLRRCLARATMAAVSSTGQLSATAVMTTPPQPPTLTTSKNLDQIISDDANLQGWNSLFAQDDSEEDLNDETPFSPQGMQSFTLRFNKDISLSLIQASSAFGGSGQDETGLVLWGASVTLGQWLIANQHSDLVRNKTVLELGCGSAVPSLVATFLGAHVVASDFRQVTLDHVQYHANLNQRSQIQVQSLNWEELPETPAFQADVVMASDVIYGVALVPALVATIQKYLKEDGMVLMATRDGRRGIAEFRQWMQQHDFEETEAQSYGETYLPPIPTELENDEVSLGRLRGNHSIYIYRRRRAKNNNS